MVDTSVPQPTFGPNGFVPPDEADILDGVRADIDAAFGGGLNPALSTPQGQLASSQTAIIGDSNAMFLWFCNQVDPAYSSGRMQDGIARIYFIERFPARGTVVTATCSGLPGTLIPIGALARATDGRLYTCTEAGRITDAGSVDLTFTCADPGPIPCAAGALSTVYQAIFGWDSITNADDGVLGREVESRSEFEERRSLSTGINSMGPLPAIVGAVLAVDGVLDAFVTENDASSSTVVGGVLLSPHTLYVCALGGDGQEIAEAIWSRKMPGCGYTGNVTFTVEDPSPSYNPPPPSYSVTFQRPFVIDFVMVVTMAYRVSVPEDALTQVQDAILNAFAGTDGGPRAKIGSTVFASRYYPPVVALGDWAQQVISVKLGIKDSGASIVGSIAGTVLAVSSVAFRTLEEGQLVSGTGVEPGTVITSLGTGTGGVGTYNVNHVQSVPSQAMTTSNLGDSATVNANQAPAISTDDIALNLVVPE